MCSPTQTFVAPPISLPSMDFDTAWCPACDKQILPKRYLVTIPPAPVPLPLPHRKGGLVSGTGRAKALRAQQQAAAALAAAQPPRQRLVIDKGPMPLYCSDACHLADINNRANDNSTSKKPKKSASTNGCGTSSKRSNPTGLLAWAFSKGPVRPLRRA